MKFLTKDWYLKKNAALIGGNKAELKRLEKTAKKARVHNECVRNITDNYFNANDCFDKVVYGFLRKGKNLVFLLEDGELTLYNAEIDKSELSCARKKGSGVITVLTAAELYYLSDDEYVFCVMFVDIDKDDGKNYWDISVKCSFIE
ncbi:MAG: hypothetical protein SOX77_03945 [Candidatus Borkfalkiaceae bacterium]|nr:hypothetical protein [Christensenellaceae bacterium]